MSWIRRSVRLTSFVGLMFPLAAPVDQAQAQATAEPAAVAAPKDDGWKKRHDVFVERAREGKVDLLFLGDSITEGWNNNPIWQRHYGARRVANFGISGDRTQNVLWRIQNGELQGIEPKVVVLMIGTNNVNSNPPAEIAEGVKAILDSIHHQSPKTKVLLLAVFPRGKNGQVPGDFAETDPRIGQINAVLETYTSLPGVSYLDIGGKFLDSEGRLPRSLMPDFLHLSRQGYRVWADAIEPTLWKMMNE